MLAEIDPVIIFVAILVVAFVSIIGFTIFISIRGEKKWKALAAKFGLTFKHPDKEVRAYFSLRGTIDGVPVRAQTFQPTDSLLNSLMQPAMDIAGQGGRNASWIRIAVTVPMPASTRAMDPHTLAQRVAQAYRKQGVDWSGGSHGYMASPESLYFVCKFSGFDETEMERAFVVLVAAHKAIA